MKTEFVLNNETAFAEAQIEGQLKIIAELKEYESELDDLAIILNKEGFTLRYSPTVQVARNTLETRGVFMKIPGEINTSWSGSLGSSLFNRVVFQHKTLAEMVAYIKARMTGVKISLSRGES